MALIVSNLVKKLSPFKPAQNEQKKIIIDATLNCALRRGLIHLLPVLVSILLISINLKHLYIGPDLTFLSWTTTNSLAAFQIAAKIQELLAVASMSTVLFEVIRHQLLYGEGLPLGLLSSGFTFDKFGFLSKGTWAWFRGKSRMWQKIFLLFCLTFTALLASVIGPAGAVLMLPRPVNQVVYTPRFWLNGTSDDLFPTMLTDAHIGHPSTPNVSSPNPCTLSNSFMNEHCVSRAYQKMQALLDSTPNTSYYDWTVIFRESSVARVLKLHEHIETWARAPHVATAYVQNIFWWDPTWFNRFTQSPNGRTSVVESQAASVRTACLSQNVTTNTTQIEFPLLELYSTYHYNTTTSVTVKTDIWSKNNASFVDPDLVRTVWIEGAQGVEAITAGLVVLGPLARSNETTRSALACSIDAWWCDSNHVQSDGPLDIAVGADVTSARGNDGSGSEFLPANNSHWKHVETSMAWLNALTPTVPYLSSRLDLTRNASTIANLLRITGHNRPPPLANFEHGYLDSPYQFWESLIATYFADGMARVGYSQQLNSALFFVEGSEEEEGSHNCVKNIHVAGRHVNTCPEEQPKSANLTAFSLNGKLVSIYAYRASANTDFLSIAIILTYACIATAHFLYCLVRKRSSRAWENLDDLLALVHSSQPEPAVLSNTSAGMNEASTKSKVVRIVVVGDGMGKENEEEDDDDDGHDDDEEGRVGVQGRGAFQREEEALQMRFVEGMHDGVMFGRVEVGVKYGKVE